MINTNLNINTDELIHWFNALRNLPEEQRTRALDATWHGQIVSKCWLVNSLPDYVLGKQNIYIFGGWIGILGNMLLNTGVANKVRSIDLDPWCEKIADDVNKIHEMNDWRFKARTADMSTYDYEWGIHPHIVINTSTEHVTQETYQQWYDRIPCGTLVVVQGNNFFDCPEHIRCSRDLDEFNRQNLATNTLFTGQLPTAVYNRYMSIWRK